MHKEFILPWLAAFSFVCSAADVLPPASPQLTNYDKRIPITPDASSRPAFATSFQSKLPDAKVDFDVITGSPKWIRREQGFLTGPAGEGKAISPATLAALPTSETNRGHGCFRP